jgi:hypothetical protein
VGTEFEASNPYDSGAFARLRERVLAEMNQAHAAAFDEYYERTGEMPTSSAQLWSTARPSEHNPYPADGLPAALDITPGWCAPDDMFDLYAARDAATRALANAMGPYLTEQLYDLTAPEMSTVGLPVVGPGDWAAVIDAADRADDFAAVYAAVDPGNDDTGEWESYYKACQPDGFGGYWMVNAPPIDPAFARRVVENAMDRIGMKRRGRGGG